MSGGRQERRSRQGEAHLPIVSAKLAPPRAQAQVVARSRVALPSDGRLSRLTIVKAPAGFGKTTLLQQWHDALVGRHRDVVWVTLDAADNAAARLGAHIGAALRHASGTSTAAGMTGERIFEEISLRPAQGKPPLVLMIDEVEAITSDDALYLLQGLVRLTSPAFAIIVAGRSIPPIGQARLALEGAVAEMTSDTLKFDEAEACALLRTRLGTRISAEEAIQLGDRLEGWAAGLQFACLALRDRADVAGFVNRAAAHGAIADYLREDVFIRLPADLRDFLTTTSPFAILTADLCDRVTGRSDSAATLAGLERAGLFIKRVEIDRDVVGYRFHDVFATFLRGQLALRGAAHIANLHRIASGWYADQGHWLEAIDHAVQGGDRQNTLRLLDTVAMDYVGWGYLEALLTWNSRVTLEEAPHFPYALCAWLWAEVLAGRYTLVTESLAAFRRARDPAVALNPILRDNFTSIEITNACAADRFEETLAKAVPALPTMHRLNGYETTSIANVLVSTHLADGDLPAARVALDVSRRSVQASDRTVNHAYTQVADAMVAMTELRLADATASLRLALDRAVAERGHYSHAAGLCASGLGEALYEANRIAEAEQAIEGRIATVTKIGWPDCALNINLTATRIAVLRGDYGLAGEILSRAQALCAHREAPRMLRTLQWEQAHVAWLAGEPDESLRLERLIAPDSDSRFLPYVEAMTRDIAPIRLSLLRGRVAGLTPRIVRLMAQAKNLGFRRRWLKLAVLHAIALSLEGRREAAVGEMARALRVGLPAGFLRCFIEEGEVSVGLVRAAGAQPDLAMRAFAPQLDRLRAAIDDKAGMTDGVPPTQSDSPRTQLTERELEIIDIAARGLTNVEIGQCLALTEPTVKWHMQKALRKLGVGNRTEAIFLTRR